MKVVNIDGKPVFATHIIEVSKDTQEEIPFQVEEEGIVCYSRNQAVKATKRLKELGVGYTIKPLDVAKQSQIDESIKFENRTEILEYIQNGKPPKYKEELDLKRKVDKLEKQVEMLITKLNAK